MNKKPGELYNKHMKHKRGLRPASAVVKTEQDASRQMYKKPKHKKNWIAGAIGKPGALHRELGIKAGSKIPAKTLSKAAGKGGKLGKRARLAETLKGFHHKKGKKMEKKHEKHMKHNSAMCKTHKKMCPKCKEHKKMHCKKCA